MRHPPASLALCALCACGGNDFSQSYQLDRVRLLAVAAEPAEPQPGETVVFETLRYYPPDVAEGLSVWFACIPDSADASGCTLDEALLAELGALDPEALSPEEQAALFAEAQAAGLAGLEPYLAPSWTVPEDALDGLDDFAAQEGLSGMVSVSLLPEGGAEDPELAYKRVPISRSPTPNHNPTVVGWRVDGAELGLDEAGLRLGRGDAAEIELVLGEGAIEDYSYVDPDTGAESPRTEEPYFTFYVEDGSFDQPFTLYDPDVPEAAVVEYSAPDAAMEGALRAVVRDRRGGMAWAELPITVE
jgi:hypothetical protein